MPSDTGVFYESDFNRLLDHRYVIPGHRRTWILAPFTGTLYGDRINEGDLRVATILTFGRTRTNIGFHIYNLMNLAPVLSYNQALSPTTTTWLTPTGVLQPRFLKFSVLVDF